MAVTNINSLHQSKGINDFIACEPKPTDLKDSNHPESTKMLDKFEEDGKKSESDHEKLEEIDAKMTKDTFDFFDWVEHFEETYYCGKDLTPWNSCLQSKHSDGDEIKSIQRNSDYNFAEKNISTNYILAMLRMDSIVGDVEDVNSAGILKHLIRNFNNFVEINGINHYHSAELMLPIGDHYYCLNEADLAFQLYSKALSIFQKGLDRYCPQVTDLQIRLGKLHLLKREFSKSLNNFNGALISKINMLGEYNSEVATLYEYLSVVHSEMGRPIDAVDKLRKALSVYCNILGKTHIKVVYVIESIGVLYSLGGYGNKSVKIMNKVVKLKRISFGSETVEVANSLLLLGICLQRSGAFTKAIDAIKQSYMLYSNTIKDHPSVPFALTRIGNLYATLGDYKGAMKAHTLALQFRSKVMSCTGEILAMNFVDIGKNAKHLNDYKKAERCFLKALKIFQNTKVMNVNNVSDTLNYLGEVYEKQHRFQEALENFQLALSMKRTSCEDDLGEIFCSIGNMHLKCGEAKLGLDSYLCALNQFENKFGRYNQHYVDALVKTGSILEELKKYRNTKSTYISALKILKCISPGHPLIDDLLERIQVLHLGDEEHYTDRIIQDIHYILD